MIFSLQITLIYTEMHRLKFIPYRELYPDRFVLYNTGSASQNLVQGSIISV
jgi:hypothetical protein